MGYSLSTGKAETLAWFQQHGPFQRILDIGAGSGTYINLIKIKNRVCQDAEWVGIEAWAEYVEKFNLQHKYNRVINQDVRTVDWNSMGKFDVAIAGDVLEHMTKSEAVELVEHILDHCATLIISIPIIHMPQDAIEGNPYEVHVKDDWSHDEVMATWPQYIQEHYRKSGKSKIGVYWLSKQNAH
jgi:predicted TPR repeat methyltransferase